MTSYDAVFPHNIYEQASNHLLKHVRANKLPRGTLLCSMASEYGQE